MPSTPSAPLSAPSFATRSATRFATRSAPSPAPAGPTRSTRSTRCGASSATAAPRAAAWLTLAVAATLLAACGTTAPPGKAPPRGGSHPAGPQGPGGATPRSLPADPDRDGPEANPPPDLHRVPDAEPVVEPLRNGGPNKPYEIDGQGYVPMTADEPVRQRGLASWYGRKFHGRRTASGEVYNMYAMTAAHPTFPIPSYARVRNPGNSQEVVVRINDRGPFKAGRIIDLSYTAALKLGVLGGVAPVEVERLTHEAIRTGSWRRPVETRSGGDATGPVFDAPGGATNTTRDADPDARPAQLSAVRQDVATGGALAVTALAPLVASPSPSPSAPAWDTQPSANPPPLAVPATAASPATDPVTSPATTTPAGATPAQAADADRSRAAGRAPPAAEAAIPGTGAGPAATASPARAAAAVPPARTPPEELPRERAGTQAARGWWLQLGAYKSADGAAQHQRQLSGAVGWLAPLLTLFREDALNKVQAGPFPSRAEAQAASQRLRSQLPLVPMLVERR